MDNPTGDNVEVHPRRSRRKQQQSTPRVNDGFLDRARRPKNRKVVEAGPTSIPSTVEKDSEAFEELISEDDLCPVCQLLLYRPVTTQCKHTLCESCMAHWADVSVAQQMTIVDVDEEPVAFNAVSGLEAKCPMCRTQTNAAFDRARSQLLNETYPNSSAERRAEEQQNEGREGSIQTLTVYIGNRHRLVDNDDESPNIHEWVFFVKPSRPAIVEEVQIQLHETFRPNRVIRQRPPYEIRRLGWGYFTLVAYVILKAGYSWVSSDAQNSPDGAEKGMLPLEWTLDFNGYGGKGSMGRCRLKVNHDRAWVDVSDEEEEDDREWQRTVRQYQRDGIYEPDDL